MSKTKATVGTRIQPYLSPDLHKHFKRHCKAHGLSESSVVEAALQEYLDDTKDMTMVYRRLDRQQRAIGRLHRDLNVLAEAFAVYVQLYFAHTPEVEANEKEAAKHQGFRRYGQFVEYVAKQYGGGHRFIDDLAEDVADDDELREILEKESTL